MTPHRPHRWSRRVPWPKCRACGLVFLRNPKTEAAIRAGCDKGEET